MTNEQNNQSIIENLLRGTGRTGIDNVIEQLKKGGFYTAPASVKFHNNFKGGLARHTLQVYQKAIELYNGLKAKGTELPFNEDSVTLCSLLHDICKMDEYTIFNGKAHHTQVYHENKKKKHGTKSVDLLTAWGLELTDEEIKAIHWHMGDWAKNAPNIYGHDYVFASSQSILVELIHDADSQAARDHIK
ncbi:MAG: HD domain-containing protein [Muribaculaceae bacterium]|nr:HD domain-containing protein [Muribaculaceae bacterium]